MIALNSLKRPVTVQTHLTLEVFFATMRGFYNAKQCFFREKPELYGANTLAECVAHSRAYLQCEAMAVQSNDIAARSVTCTRPSRGRVL